MKDLTVTIVPAHAERDVEVEDRYTHLRTSGFVRGVTAMDQWFLLVGEAWQRTRLPMNEVIRDYLTTMLDRFTRRAELLEQLALFEFVPYLLGERAFDSVSRQDVADMSLQYVAFFPGRSRYRHEPRSLEMSASIGVTLYQQLSFDAKGKDDWFSRAYTEMSTAFGQAVLVLRAMNRAFCFQDPGSSTTRNNALLFPTDAQGHDISKAFKQFDGMYLAPPADSGSRDN